MDFQGFDKYVFFFFLNLGFPTSVWSLVSWCPVSKLHSLWQLVTKMGIKEGKVQVSHEKNPGWLGYIGDYTTQSYRDYFINHETRIPINQPVFHGK